MQQRVSGFDLDVSVRDGCPQVRVCMGERVILETDALSSTGLQNLAVVLERAAKIAAGELDRYWYQQQRQLRRAD